jgi:hypothetical protein
MKDIRQMYNCSPLSIKVTPSEKEHNISTISSKTEVFDKIRVIESGHKQSEIYPATYFSINIPLFIDRLFFINRPFFIIVNQKS